MNVYQEAPKPCDRPPLTDADRAVLDAAEVIERDHQRTGMVLGGARFPCQCSICVTVRARREAQ